MQFKPFADDYRLPTIDRLNMWFGSEIRALYFADERLAKRFDTLFGMMTRRVGDSLPAACENWAVWWFLAISSGKGGLTGGG